MRVDAMRQIRDARGLPAILELAERGKASWQIGVHAARDLLSEEELQEASAARAPASTGR